MGQTRTTCSQCLQFLSLPEQQGISICFDVQQIPNYSSSKAAGTEAEILWRKRQPTKDGYVKKIVHGCCG